MSWFSKKRHLIRSGAIIDIGSGSVGCAVVTVNSVSGEKHLIWTHREYTLLRSGTTDIDNKRALRTALVNVFLELGSSGVKALATFDSTLSLTDVQVNISAPWQHTVTRDVRLTDPAPFVVDEKLIRDLNDLARDEALETCKKNDLLRSYQLEIVTQEHTGITIDGYKVTDFFDKKVTDLSFTHITTLAHADIIQTLHEVHQKVVPATTLSISSFMYSYYVVTNSLYPHTFEACLIDVTNDATEMAIVRDGTLTCVTHIPVGNGTLARRIAETLSIPVGEALTLTRHSREREASKFPDKKKNLISKIFSDYQKELIVLMNHTGDDLSVPHTIFLHTDSLSEQFYKELLAEVSSFVTNSKHTVHSVTSELISESHTGDTAILLGVQYFANKISDAQ